MTRTLHVVGLPHTQTTHEFDHCAFTAKARKFCGMMRGQGYRVLLYAGDENDADCDGLVTCVTRAEQHATYGDWWRRGEVQNVEWSGPSWERWNSRLLTELTARVHPDDVVCLPTGVPHQWLIDRLPCLCVETGVGYEGVAQRTFKVFESYAWMHAVYGKGGASKADGQWFDAVIANYYDVREFGAGAGDGGYFAFLSRMTHRKGYGIAIDATEALGTELRIGGIGGDRPEAGHVNYVGKVDPVARAELLGGAIATFVPTHYLEPFGGVAAESLLCGTPVICSDWGAFPEYVEHGIDGFRCRTMAEFIAAGQDAAFLDRAAIRRRAQARFSTAVIGAQYHRFFDRLDTLTDGGFYAADPGRMIHHGR